MSNKIKIGDYINYRHDEDFGKVIRIDDNQIWCRWKNMPTHESWVCLSDMNITWELANYINTDLYKVLVGDKQ